MRDDSREIRSASNTGSRIDFHAVEEHQREIDARLINWGRWCNGSTALGVCPMFRMVPPPPRVRGDLSLTSDSVDGADAALIAKAVVALPSSHRAAVNWAYVKPVNPRKACVAMGTNMAGLAQLLRDGRQMLINRLGR
jgi:hypothetical protein